MESQGGRWDKASWILGTVAALVVLWLIRQIIRAAHEMLAEHSEAYRWCVLAIVVEVATMIGMTLWGYTLADPNRLRNERDYSLEQTKFAQSVFVFAAQALAITVVVLMGVSWWESLPDDPIGNFLKFR